MKAVSVFLMVLLFFSTSLQAGPIGDQRAIHPVSIEDLRVEVSEQTAERTSNIREIQTLLRNDRVQDRLGHLFDLEKVAVAVPTLDDETLARLAQESAKANEQFRAGLSTVVWVVIIVAVLLVVGLLIAANTAKDVISSF